jgi:REP-associated tyrosine transposase
MEYGTREISMPRKPRAFLADQPQHIVVRGHNRDPIVARKADYQYFVECLQNGRERYGLAIHAWVLMTNHIHLLVTPETGQSLPKTMQWLGGHYARYFNRCYRRSGSLWEGRYKSSLVDTERYLLLCYRYIEMNPVRTNMVEQASDYPWSSYRGNALGQADSLLTAHPVYLALGQDTEARQAVYKSLFKEVLGTKELTAIRRGTQKEQAVGNPEFLTKMASLRR